jgi:4-alpha-glucanotransferase
MNRASGILLHPTSLPGPYGIGDLGPGAFQFVDFLKAAGQRFWQIMPLGPTGFGDSPYQCFSAFAGNPYLVSLDALAQQGWLDHAALATAPAFPATRTDYGPVIEFHRAMLAAAFARFMRAGTPAQHAALDAFIKEHADWLDDFARFMALKEFHHDRIWNTWSAGKHKLYDVAPPDLDARIRYHAFVQWQFFTQWQALRAYAHKHGVQIIGDVPIFVAYDSADVWAHPRLFKLDDKGMMTFVAGVPPDYFSVTGQLWGNPLYDWDACRREQFAWWVARFRAVLRMVDVVRIDHFRGFAAAWHVPAGNPTAEHGEWLPSPGGELFERVRATLGTLPIIAENLGLITPDVEKLRALFGFPGMKIMQFGFGDDDATNEFLPHNYPTNCVAYTGSHDNDTTRGWYARVDEKTRDHVRRYFGVSGADIAWDMVRAVLASVADTAIVPLQDILNLDNAARMNYPGNPDGNWQWRFTADQLTDFITARLHDLAKLYGRMPLPSKKKLKT